MKEAGNKRPTIAEVARMAHVAPSTVSHVLNGTAPISPATARRVNEVIEKLNFTPNPLARSLRQRKSCLIGVVLQDITSEFYASCVASLMKAARLDNYNALICDAQWDSELVRESVKNLIDNRIDGLIFIGGSNDEEIIKTALDAGVRVIIGDRRVEGLPQVEFRNADTMRRLTCALCESGYRRFLYAGEPLSVQTNLGDRYRGFLEGLAASGVPHDPDIDFFDHRMLGFKLSESYQRFRDCYLRFPESERPRIIVTSNDMIAGGFISAAEKSGLRVPEDLAVVGFDDVIFSSCYSPTLTIVHQDSARLGRECYDLFRRAEEGEDVSEEHIWLPQEIVARESAPIPPEILKKYN